ncbi:SEL1-like repeat protein [Myroides sp. NP-2]|uniref:SEL1-like repeat protein n=1 Tax=Myroides sp. NP-2 TaxID=2759945 RepID=UPI0015FC58FC|nr:SEL1-like repeat protein [Myroides sp. NP-2]MBB1149820.1 SEL1-like repeat protein [Myroides sp. NP-2]
MAHRIYLYNLDSQTQHMFEGYLGEWNYVIPDLLLPLLSANPRAKGEALYFDKEEGLLRLSDFYDLLTETYQLEEVADFTTAVTQMFEFLYELPYDTFYLDASDVYTMNEESPKEQAKEWMAEIHEKWLLYQQAIEQGDIHLLDEFIQSSGYTSFLEALQQDWVKYGLGYWEEDIRRPTRTIRFEEAEKWGLKATDGTVLLPAIYDAIYDFSEVNLAVVEQGGKFSYINEQGELLFPLIYDDAFDAYSIHQTTVGIACIADKMGLINLDTLQWGIPPAYDEIEQVFSGFYNVLQQGQYQLMDYTGKYIISEPSAFPFVLDYPHKFYTAQQHTAKRKYYTLDGQWIGEYPEEALEELSRGYFWVKPNKYQKKISILDPKGKVVVEEVDQLLNFTNYNTFAYKVNKQWMLWDCQEHQQRLHDLSISKIHAKYLCNYSPDTYVVHSEQSCGLYHAAQDLWLIERSNAFVKIEHLNHPFVQVIEKQGMRYYNYETGFLSECYTHISAPIDRYTQQICLFAQNQLYYVDDNWNCIAVSDEQMGQLYEQRYNLRGKDLSVFIAFYQAWIQRMGDDYEAYFDVDTLYKRGCDARDQADWSEAMKYFTLGAKRGDARMQYELGLLLTEDQQLWTDVDQGVYYLEQAAQQDYANAWNTIGYLYQNGLGYTYDREAMLAAYEKAVALGCIWANMNLGDLYFYGQDVAQDFDKAVSYYSAAEHYYGAYAQNLVEIHYQRREFEQVLRYLKRNRTEPYIHIYYGILYDYGYGVKLSEEKAIQHYEQALEHSSYFYAVERLLYYYNEHPQYKDPIKYTRILAYAKENEII